jgi:predicted TIM-barrel fold metal-dependent hydrolase
MGMPTDVGIIDTMIGFPSPDMKEQYRFITSHTKDTQSRDEFEFPVEYMFKDVPDKRYDHSSDPLAITLGEMDHWGIDKGMIGVGGEVNPRALTEHPDRFIPSFGAEPNEGTAGIRKLVEAYERFGIKSVNLFPCGYNPQVPINDKKMYPIYAKCVELDIPVFCCAGVPGPRVPMAPQKVELIDEVMYDFPELVFVTRHGCEPWADLMVKLMIKWPNLYYSTSAFAPKYYPKAVIDYANTRGGDRIIYAGYFPMGLSIERIMTDMPGVPLKDDVWPKFLRDNAARVLKLDR